MALNMGPAPVPYTGFNPIPASWGSTATPPAAPAAPAPITVPDLSSRAMLVSLTMQSWSGRKFDKDVTKEVAQQHGTKEKAGRYNKRLLPEAAPEYEALMKVIGQARAEHLKLTSPWANDGTRILYSPLYWEYMEAMRKHRYNFDTALQAFVAAYPAMIDKAEAELNGLFNREEYPHPSRLEHKFRFHVMAYPMPDVKDFRVNVSDEETARLRADLERQLKETVEAAMRDAWQRLYVPVKEMAERLADDRRLMEPSFVLLGETCRILRHLNVCNDPHLDELVSQVEASLTTKPKDKEARELAALRAQEIMDKMAAFMPAPEN